MPTHLDGPLSIEVLVWRILGSGLRRAGSRRVRALPVCPELDLSLEQSLLAERGGEDLEEPELESFCGERMCCDDDGSEYLVEEDVEAAEGLDVEFYGTDVGENDVCGTGGDVLRPCWTCETPAETSDAAWTVSLGRKGAHRCQQPWSFGMLWTVRKRDKERMRTLNREGDGETTVSNKLARHYFARC